MRPGDWSSGLTLACVCTAFLLGTLFGQHGNYVVVSVACFMLGCVTILSLVTWGV